MASSKKPQRSAKTTILNEWVQLSWTELTSGKFYLINAPWGFSTVWSVVKRWLDPVTVEKISILGSSYQSELLKQIPADNLPVEFGGNCQCPGGCALSDEGPWQDPQWLAPQTKEEESTSPAQVHKENAESFKSASSAPDASAETGEGIEPDAGAPIAQEETA